MQKDPLISATWIIGCLLIIGFIAFIIFATWANKSGQSEQDKSSVYSDGESLAPRIVLTPSFFDAGSLRNKTDMVTTSFKITNGGKSDLAIKSITTSCHCTTAQLDYGNSLSQKFGMTKDPSWSESIKPGESGTVYVEYDPKKMLEDGLIKRAVYIETNDLRNPELVFSFQVENNL